MPDRSDHLAEQALNLRLGLRFHRKMFELFEQFQCGKPFPHPGGGMTDRHNVTIFRFHFVPIEQQARFHPCAQVGQTRTKAVGEFRIRGRPFAAPLRQDASDGDRGAPG